MSFMSFVDSSQFNLRFVSFAINEKKETCSLSKQIINRFLLYIHVFLRLSCLKYFSLLVNVIDAHRKRTCRPCDRIADDDLL